MKFHQLLPGTTDRAFIAGQTGSGKTELAERLCRSRQQVVVLDTKGEIAWKPYELFESLDKLYEIDPRKTTRIIYRPNFWEQQDQKVIDEFFQWVYERQNTTLYVDEALSISKSHYIPPHYLACLTRGRSRRVETWSSSQRPSGLHQTILSEAEHYYLFKLKLIPDSEKMESMTAIPAEKIRALPKTRFFYFNFDDQNDTDNIQSLRIKL